MILNAVPPQGEEPISDVRTQLGGLSDPLESLDLEHPVVAEVPRQEESERTESRPREKDDE